jgi:hypothetical protein
MTDHLNDHLDELLPAALNLRARRGVDSSVGDG